MKGMKSKGMKIKGMKNKGKKLTATLLIAVFILTTLAIAIPVSATAAAVTVTIDYPYVSIGPDLVLGTTPEDATAEWTTDQAEFGSYSAKLTQGASSGIPYVQFTPIQEITGSTLSSITELSYMYFTAESIHIYIELLFDDPDSDGFVEVYEQKPFAEGATNTWIERDVAASTYFALYGEDESGDTINYWLHEKDLSTVYTSMTAESDDNDWDNWVLTRVRVHLYEAGTDIVYIDDITIDSVTYPIEPVRRTITVDNPAGNPGISTITISVPEDAAELVPETQPDDFVGFIGAPEMSVAGSGPWAIISQATTEAGAVILPGGAAGKLNFEFTSEIEEDTAGEADAYTFTISVKFEDDEIQNHEVTIYECETESIAITIDPKSTIVTGIAVAAGGTATSFDTDLTEADDYYNGMTIRFTEGVLEGQMRIIDDYAVANGKITVTVAFSEAPGNDAFIIEDKIVVGTSTDLIAVTDSIVEGLPLEMEFTPSVEAPFAASITPAQGTTDEDGEIESTFVSTEAEDYTIGVDLGTIDALSSGGIISVTTAEVILMADDPSVVDVTIWAQDGTPPTEAMDDIDSTITYLYQDEVFVRAELKDKYGNPVEVTAETAVIFSETAGELGPQGTSIKIPSGESESGTLTYEPVDVYGSSAMISAELTYLTTTYSGNSKPLFTSTFVTTFSVTPDSIEEVQVGEYSTITIDLNSDPIQENVPVTFSIVEVTEDYDGTLSVISTVTDEDGIAKTNLNVDNTVGDKAYVKVTIARPTSEDPTNTIDEESADITTIEGDPALLVVNTYEPDTSTEKSIVVPEGELDVEVSLTDAYGNPVDHTTEIQVSLLASAGSLSSTTIYLPATTSTYTVLFTAPSEAAQVTITATTTQAGISLDTATVNVAGPEPVLTITDPAADTTITSDVAIIRYIEGYAEVSLAQPTGTAILLFKYSLDGAANVTAPITDIEAGKYYFNFYVSLAPDAAHTIVVYATDTTDETSYATRVITITPEAQPELPAETTGQEAQDSTGGTKTSFTSGEIVNAYSEIANVGDDIETILIVVQFKDPNNVVYAPCFLTVELDPGEDFGYAPGLTILSGYTTGTWTAKINLFTTWPSLDGEPIGLPVTITFEVTS